MAKKHRLGSVQSLSPYVALSGYLPYFALLCRPKRRQIAVRLQDYSFNSFRRVCRDNKMAGDALVAGKVACKNRYHGTLGYIGPAVQTPLTVCLSGPRPCAGYCIVASTSCLSEVPVPFRLDFFTQVVTLTASAIYVPKLSFSHAFLLTRCHQAIRYPLSVKTLPRSTLRDWLAITFLSRAAAPTSFRSYPPTFQSILGHCCLTAALIHSRDVPKASESSLPFSFAVQAFR